VIDFYRIIISVSDAAVVMQFCFLFYFQHVKAVGLQQGKGEHVTPVTWF